MRAGYTEIELVKCVVNKYSQVNTHDKKLLEQHAAELNLNGLPNLPEDKVSEIKSDIESWIKDGQTASQAVEWAENKLGRFNKHDEGLFTQYATELEENIIANLPNQSDEMIQMVQEDLESDLRRGQTGEQAIDSLVKMCGRLSIHDMNLLRQHVKGLELNGLPNLSDKVILKYQARIKLEMSNGLTADEAVEEAVARYGQVSRHERELFMQHAQSLRT